MPARTGLAVSWGRLLALLAGVAAVSIVGSGALAYWMLTRYTAHLPLSNMPMQVTMPENLPVRVRVLSGGPPDAQTAAERRSGVPVHFKETLHLNADLDAVVPLHMEVPFHGDIPVNMSLPLDTQVSIRVLGVPVNVPVRGNIPLSVRVPVDLRIPIDQPVRLRFSAPLSVHVDQTVHIPLQAQLDTLIQFEPMIPITVLQADLALPLGRMSLSGPVPFAGDGVTLGPLAPQLETPAAAPRSQD